MATSNSRDFTLNRDDFIAHAFYELNIYNIGTAITYKDNKFASDILNLVLKTWQARGLKLWNRKEATLFTAYQTSKYNLGLTGTHATNSYVNTTLSAAEASGQTILSATSSAGMTAADKIGIALDDGTRQWTTIASVDSSTQITVDDALTGAAAAGNTIVAYTTKVERPLQVFSARYQDITLTSEIPLNMLSHEEYFDQTEKSTYGHPIEFYYDKQLTNGVLYLWPTPNNVDFIVNFTYNEELEDMDNASDNFDLPSEWLDALNLTLQYRLANAYNKLDKLPILKQESAEAYALAENFNNRDANVKIAPNLRNY